MQWTLNEPKFGDIIRVKLGQFYHYGIYVDDEEIIQFGLPLTDVRRDSKNVEVCATDMDTFLCGNFLEVGQSEKKEGKKKKPSQIVKMARSRLGEKGYHILYNNCEHFAYECLFGKKKSSQVDDVRAMWKNFPFVNVYVKTFPFATDRGLIFPKERQEEIDKCGSEKVRQEKYYSWKLLEYGLRHSLGLDIKNIKFEKKGRKWSCPDCHFSISHCDNIVAVAVARNEIGVDIEKIDLERFSLFPPQKILTDKEMESQFDAEDINRLWTVKEALFKQGKDKTFFPNKVCTSEKSFVSIKLKNEDNDFYLSVATKDISLIKFHIDENISQR